MANTSQNISDEILARFFKIEKIGNAQEDYLYRFVQSKNELREKLFIFDAGLDNRAIEILKFLYIN